MGFNPAVSGIGQEEKEIGVPMRINDSEQPDFMQAIGKLNGNLIALEVFFEGVDLQRAG